MVNKSFHYPRIICPKILPTNKLLHKEAITTAWFCETMHTWFELATSRRRTLALGKETDRNYTNATY
jgi:hypothetical protein